MINGDFKMVKSLDSSHLNLCCQLKAEYCVNEYKNTSIFSALIWCTSNGQNFQIKYKIETIHMFGYFVGTWILCARLGGKLREGMFLQAIFLGQAVGNVICPLFAHPFMSAPAQNTSITSHGRVFEHLNHLVKPG